MCYYCPLRYRNKICVPRMAPNFSARPPSANIRHQGPVDGNSLPLSSTSVRDGNAASGVVNVAIVFILPLLRTGCVSVYEKRPWQTSSKAERNASTSRAVCAAETKLHSNCDGAM